MPEANGAETEETRAKPGNADEQPKPVEEAPKTDDTKAEDEKSFWGTLPGLLTGIGGILAAIATLITALSTAGVIGPADTPTPTATATETARPPSPTWTHTPTSTAAPSATWTPTMVASATPAASATWTLVPESAVLFRDDFETLNGTWEVADTETYILGYENGAYFIRVKPAQHEVWIAPEGMDPVRNFIAEVEVRHAAGPEDNDYGLVVRYNTDVQRFYMLVVSSDGFYQVQRYDEQTWESVVPWTASAAIHQGLGSTNYLRVECTGNTIRFYTNGVLLTVVDDPLSEAGSVGLIAGTGEAGNVVAAFDNLVIRRPAQ